MSVGIVRDRSVDRQSAADELAGRLAGLADHLGSRVRPSRWHYGHGLLGRFKSRSPEGFAVGRSQLLLPDGRIWTYSRSDAHRFPDGRIFDPRTDHTHYSSVRTFPGGTEFHFLGLVLGKFSFGVAHEAAHSTEGLCAITTEGGRLHYVDPDGAFAELAAAV